HLTFADCGRGIEIKHQKKIFNMFYRVRRKDENIRGSGLGLFIVRATIKRHRGRISVESAGQNQGTSFHIYLPLSKKPLAEEPK
ncbi:MAG: ATP-binding protein, partial [Deltaproteobacteria bacterium]|nr:ATP-binding protein [Deltaproteobacteria bacterium]